MFLKPVSFLPLQIHHLMKREIDPGTICRSIDDERDVELDGNDLLDQDSEHNDDDFESDLLSDSEDRTGFAEFQWSPTLPELTLA